MKSFKVLCVVIVLLCGHVHAEGESFSDDDDDGFLQSFWKWKRSTFDGETKDTGFMYDEETDEQVYVTPMVMAQQIGPKGSASPKQSMDELFEKFAELDFESPENVHRAELVMDGFEKLLEADGENSVYFFLNDGLQKIVYKSIRSGVEPVIIRGLVLLGGMNYNNYQIQMMCLESGVLDTLKRLLDEITQETVALRVVYALGTILKGCPEAQHEFFNAAEGFESLMYASKVASMRLRFIMSSLLDDLLFESNEAYRNGDHVEQKLYKEIDLEKKLFENDQFCYLIRDVFEDIVNSDSKQFATTRPLIRILHKHHRRCAMVFNRETRKCFTVLKETPGFEDDLVLIDDIVDMIYKVRRDEL